MKITEHYPGVCDITRETDSIIECAQQRPSKRQQRATVNAWLKSARRPWDEGQQRLEARARRSRRSRRFVLWGALALALLYLAASICFHR